MNQFFLNIIDSDFLGQKKKMWRWGLFLALCYQVETLLKDG